MMMPASTTFCVLSGVWSLSHLPFPFSLSLPPPPPSLHHHHPSTSLATRHLHLLGWRLGARAGVAYAVIMPSDAIATIMLLIHCRRIPIVNRIKKLVPW